MSGNMKTYLMQAFRRLLGDKGYMRDLDKIIERIELTPEEEATLRYLVVDLNSMRTDLNNLEIKSKRRW
jgi:hypothetical protein